MDADQSTGRLEYGLPVKWVRPLKVHWGLSTDPGHDGSSHGHGTEPV